MAGFLSGLDVSVFQDTPDWEQVKLDGYSFASAKATEGTSVKDKQFPRNWERMKERRLLRFAYHFFYDSLDPIRQLQFHHTYVRENGKYEYGDAGMIDVEEAGIKKGKAAVPLIEQFIKAFWRNINKPLMFYTNYDTWVNLLGNPQSKIIAQCPLWLSDFGPYVPHLDEWPNGLSFWQYTDNARIPGVDSDVDLNRFYGTREQLVKIMTEVPAHK